MTTSADRVDTRRRPVQSFSLLVGAVFLLVGVLGFIPGVTDHYEHLGFAGPGSDAELFGVFEVSVLHNLLHLLFGVLGVAAARAAGASRAFLVVGGFLYLLLWVYGSIIDVDSAVNFAPFNSADNLLHLGLGAGMILLAVLATALERSRGQYPGREQRGR
ncbi:DUF4383 domain-containing protein [Saccharothrix syringae]|uniref:DUF4383 domain-containing protein n=1 Tax=Saccharothrix syringae TaxID=103733 RepID=A0A5Q0H661_SACSY|nr:DUF4383 domain-containing protein [Saccharothrix syringae]QFZ21350.1 DUF4383 domain-containing protein [Saccharothrix syringae]